jgi:PAS domain S-box-containing protein
MSDHQVANASRRSPRAKTAVAKSKQHIASQGDVPGFLAGGGEMGARIRAFDWSNTPLGPAESWPQSLKTAVGIMLTSRQPIWIGWGRELIYFYNDPYKSIIGGKHPRMLGQPTAIVWKEIWQDIGPMLETAMGRAEGTYVEEQLLIMERHGYKEETYYTFSYSPIPNDDGRPGGIICANTDDTQRVVGERQLALLKELASRAVDARTWQEAAAQSATALCTNQSDLAFGLIYVREPESSFFSLAGSCGIRRGHEAAPELIGGQDEPWMLGRAFSGADTVVIQDLSTIFKSPLPGGAWEQAPSKVALLPISASGQTGRGGVLVVGLNPFRLFDQAYQNFLGLVSGQIAASIARAEAYEEERRRAEALAELDRAKTTFFSNVSHELRTPLTLMLGPIEDELRDHPGNSRLELAHRNSLRLLKLVNTLLDFSRIEAGRIQASYEATDLSAFTCDIASTFRSAIEKAGLKLIIDCPRLPESVYVDHEMWEKVVLNLLSNAFKFTFAGEIRVAVAWLGQRVELSVSDTGVGIPAQELDHVFERFHRVQETPSRSHEGTGIGLALVRELARLHGGDVKVQSVESQGTTFTVSIRTGKTHLPVQHIGAQRNLGSTMIHADVFTSEAFRWLPDGTGSVSPITSSDVSPGVTLAGLGTPTTANESVATDRPRILIAEDNADMRVYVSRLLGNTYEVEAVHDGQAALDSARTRPPDLVLSDVMMPRLDGFGLLKELRADERTRAIPIIMLSARAGEEARVEGLGQGADDYLIKPFSARELIARVRSQIDLAQLRQRANAELAKRVAELNKISIELRDSRRAALDLMEDAVRAKEALSKSEERFRAYVMASSDVVYCMSPDWTEMRHLQGREFIADTLEPSRTWLDKYIHPEDQSRMMAAINEGIRARSTFQLEHRVIRVDGTPGWTFSRAVPLLDDKGEILEWFGAASDITQRKEAEERLAAQRRLYQAILSTTPDLAYVFDLKHRFVYANDALLTMWGKTWDEAIGKTCLELGYEPWHAEMHDREIEQVIATNKPIRGEVPFTGTHGRRVYDYIFVPVIGTNGTVEAVAGTTRDVTERKNAAERLEQTVAERTASLREAVEQMEEFSYSVSHDLRAPLRAMTAYAGVLLEEYGRCLDDTGRNYLEKIRRSSDRMNRLTQDVLTYSRVARAQVHLEPIALERVIKDIIHQYSHLQPPAAEIEIRSPLLDVLGHEITLGQCVANLLTNAVKFIAPGIKPRVNIWTERRGKKVRTWFHDNGIGIKPEHQSRIFQMFERIHPEGTYEGTGIGLTIVRKAVEKMGGSVGVESEGQNGSRFWIELRSTEA